MRYLLLLLFLACGCTDRFQCDEKVRDLYPGHAIETIDAVDTQVYLINKKFAVGCDYGDHEVRMYSLSWKPWKMAWCDRYDPAWSSYPKECRKAEKE